MYRVGVVHVLNGLGHFCQKLFPYKKIPVPT
jgi:hypothetical protein